MPEMEQTTAFPLVCFFGHDWKIFLFMVEKQCRKKLFRNPVHFQRVVCSLWMWSGADTNAHPQLAWPYKKDRQRDDFYWLCSKDEGTSLQLYEKKPTFSHSPQSTMNIRQSEAQTHTQESSIQWCICWSKHTLESWKLFVYAFQVI